MWEKSDKPPVLGSQFFCSIIWTCPDDARLLRRVAPCSCAPHLTTRVFGHSSIFPFLGGCPTARHKEIRTSVMRNEKTAIQQAKAVVCKQSCNTTCCRENFSKYLLVTLSVRLSIRASGLFCPPLSTALEVYVCCICSGEGMCLRYMFDGRILAGSSILPTLVSYHSIHA